MDCEEAHARREEGQGGQGEARLPLPDRGPEGLTSLCSILAIVIVVLNKLALIVSEVSIAYRRVQLQGKLVEKNCLFLLW